jgi:uncharacterized protein (TIGR02246 family)
MNSEKVNKEIKELIEQWSAAVRNEDIDEILKYHSQDIVMFDVPLPLQSKGIEAYKKTWETFFSWTKKPVEFSITELEIIANDSVAFCHGIGHCSGISPKGKEEKLNFRLTVGLRKENGKWVILHEHHSIPAE